MREKLTKGGFTEEAYSFDPCAVFRSHLFRALSAAPDPMAMMVPVDDDDMPVAGMAAACPSVVQSFGTFAAGLPRSPSLTSCARKSANGAMFCRTLASSRAAI